MHADPPIEIWIHCAVFSLMSYKATPLSRLSICKIPCKLHNNTHFLPRKYLLKQREDTKTCREGDYTLSYYIVLYVYEDVLSV
jgi:hypothetical protein